MLVLYQSTVFSCTDISAKCLYSQVICERFEEFRKLYGTNKTMEQLLNDQDDTGGKKRLAFLDMLLCASTEGSSQKLSFLDI